MKYEKENIGLLIEQRMNELGINKSELARRIGMSSQYMNRLLEKSGVNTDKLISISEALDYDFFAHFRPVDEATATATGSAQAVVVSNGDNSPISQNVNKDSSPTSLSTQIELARLRERVASLEAQQKDKDARIADLKDTIALLKEKM